MKGDHDKNSIIPGQIWVSDKEKDLLSDRENVTLTVVNRGDRPVQVGSHFHFFEVNKFLDFNRTLAYGKRLAIPSGTAMRFEPGMSLNVDLIDIKGERYCYGLNGLVNGSLNSESVRKKAFKKASERGFGGAGHGN
ncbi:MAG: urease subunit beta [Spirochaetales bacterium]|nr:urease subunit beta [Spirochaetales bacterium]